MKKETLRNAIKCNFVRFFALTGLIVFIGGCAGPRMLQSRTGVPPATLEPTQNANDLNIPLTGDEDITISKDNVKKTEFPGFPKVTTETIKYKVKRGDSFWRIGRMYGVGMKELAAYNNMDLKTPLSVGKELNIPPGGKLIPKAKLASVKTRKRIEKGYSKKTNNLKDGTYTVKPGDSLWVIARRYHTTINKMAKANGLSKDAPLTIGQELIIPTGGKAAQKTGTTKKIAMKTTTKAVPLSKKDNELINNLITPQEKTNTNKDNSVDTTINTTSNFLPHTIKDGDTWSTISEMYGISADNLKKANPKIASATQPKIGSVINIPEE